MQGARWLYLVGGGLIALAGLVWAFQGAGLLGGSVMTGRREWILIGIIAVAAGLWLIRAGLPRGA